MRLRAILFALVALGLAAVGAWRLADVAAAFVERSTGERVAEALDAAGQTWARPEIDGLAVALAGIAPDETSRFRAIEVVKQVVGEQVEDRTTVEAARQIEPPRFALELLRNGEAVSVIGLVPEADARDTIREALADGGLAEGAIHMLETADHPAPQGWEASLGFGLEVLHALPRAKIGVEPGRVRVMAVAESDAASAALAERLRGAVPDGIELALDLSAPRPVIAPFVLDFALADGSGHLAACSAETEADARAIVAAARAVGLAGGADCAVGLGAPSPDWAQAVAKGLAALGELGGGRFELRDIATVLTVPEDVDPGRAAAAAERLGAALPAIFSLETVAPPQSEPGPGPLPADAPRFEARLAPDGTVRLGGPVQDATERAAIGSLAAAHFGHDRVLDAMVVEPTLPEGWPRRVLAGLEALAELKEGRLTVTPDAVALRGSALEEALDAELETLLAAKLGDAAVVEVRFDAAAAAAAASAARSRPEVCAEEIAAILAAGSIRFRPGSAEIEPASRGVIAAIADVLRSCPRAAFEIGGHTDSRGDAAANQRLSEDRAAAVVAALESADLPLTELVAKGYGPAEPVADNATVEGRAENRRIAFALISREQALAARRAVAEQADERCAAEIAGILAAEQITFATGSAAIEPAGRAVIAAIADALGDCPGAAFAIGGHTDSLGDDAANLALSEERAQAVEAALEAEALEVALSARGHGEERPVADNDTEAGRARNRRIAFVLIEPLPAPQAAIDAAPGPSSLGAAGAWDACAAKVAEILEADRIVFALGSATIAPESRYVVEAIARALGTCSGASFEIGGHTDSQGDAAANQRLSERRARAVLEALEAKNLDVALTARGHGEERPVADNDTEAGRARNRRIALTLLVAEGSDDPGAAVGTGDEPE